MEERRGVPVHPGLVDACVHVIDDYAPETAAQLPEPFVDAYLAQRMIADEDAPPFTLEEVEFVRQVLQGYLRTERQLELAMAVVLKAGAAPHKHEGETAATTADDGLEPAAAATAPAGVWHSVALLKKSDARGPMLVFLYLLLFRLDELGWPRFRRLVTAQPRSLLLKLRTMLAFFFNRENLEGPLKDSWCEHFGENYVEKELIGPLLAYAPQGAELLASLDAFLASAQLPQKPVLTKPEGFRLATASRSQLRSAKKLALAPLSERTNTCEQPCSARKKGNNSERAYTDIRHTPRRSPAPVTGALRSSSQPTVASPQKEVKQLTKQEPFELLTRKYNSERKKEQIIAEIEAERAAALKSYPKANTLPATNAVGTTPLKAPTAAMILREDYLYQKKQEEQYRQMLQYEMALHDGYEFDQWQKQMRGQDELQRITEIEERRLNTKLAREMAVEARDEAAKDKKDVAQEMGAHVKTLLEQRGRENERLMQQKRATVEEVKETEAGAQAKREGLAKKNRRAARRMRHETKTMKQQAQIELEEEVRKRDDMIRRIRALERVPVSQVKRPFDPTETSNMGLFCEMSLAELRDRLTALEAQEREQLEQKRLELRQQKDDKAVTLQEKARRNDEVRRKMFEELAARREQQAEEKRLRESELAARRQDTLALLQGKLDQKRQGECRVLMLVFLRVRDS
eukprot:TRINITY_DN7122_c0_g1_i1.p1 TRINITY_DN7122_c0_g1~~TRINITY_DN7122_c0_g1_i1.p1  ORF type:complete len:689 (-),score=225.58 TRINITY_DN7122_c0_g1_i1:194-2260(-)